MPAFMFPVIVGFHMIFSFGIHAVLQTIYCTSSDVGYWCGCPDYFFCLFWKSAFYSVGTLHNCTGGGRLEKLVLELVILHGRPSSVKQLELHLEPLL